MAGRASPVIQTLRAERGRAWRRSARSLPERSSRHSLRAWGLPRTMRTR
ncbi:hypothetical protein [Thermus thermophilus]|nr:hypothetical protein [Thermus thermophilus]